LPEEEAKKSGLCPICDSKVEANAKKCPECKADLTVFGIKSEDEELPEVMLPGNGESLDKLLGEIGKEDEMKEKELFDEIMAAVDVSKSETGEEGELEAKEVTAAEEGVEATQDVTEAPAKEAAQEATAEEAEQVTQETAAQEAEQVTQEVAAQEAEQVAQEATAEEAEQVAPETVAEEAEQVAPEVAVEKPEQAAQEAPEQVAQEAAAGQVMFECPLCKTLVNEDANSCSGCGAIFATGEGEAEAPTGAGMAEEAPVAEIEAPEAEMTQFVEEAAPMEEIQVAEEAVPAEVPEKKPKGLFGLGRKKKKEKPAPPAPAKAKPPAALEKDERALHKELASCVTEVKPLLANARQIGVNVVEGRKLIDQAISAGKQRDFETALTLVRESKENIENVISQHLTDSVQTTQLKIDALVKAGANVEELKTKVGQVKSLLDTKKFIEAGNLAKTAADDAESSILRLKATMKQKERMEKGEDANEKLKELIDLIKSGEKVKVDVKKAKALLTQARVAMKKNELDKANDLLTQAKEDFLRELPKQLTEIISSSKPVLYKAKMQGVDIRNSIKLLKEASTALKLNNYIDALEAIKRYKAEMNQYMS
jgi:hypothetical protein